MKFISLFSGIGGLDLGLQRAGMTCIAQVEKDEFCRRVLAKHWPDVPRFDDVCTFGKDVFDGPVDLIAGGFPCQPHSQAGKRRGAADDRNLWPEYRRIVGEYKPAWVLGENVPGIRHTMLDDVLSDLEDLDYETRTIVIPACALDAPHIRERVFIVAYTESARRLWDRNQPAEPREVREWHDVDAKGAIVAYAQRFRLEEPRHSRVPTGQTDPASDCRWWPTEPGVCRILNGVPSRVDRLRGLGNAVVPQVAEWIGRQIMKAEELCL